LVSSPLLRRNFSLPLLFFKLEVPSRGCFSPVARGSVSEGKDNLIQPPLRRLALLRSRPSDMLDARFFGYACLAGHQRIPRSARPYDREIPQPSYHARVPSLAFPRQHAPADSLNSRKVLREQSPCDPPRSRLLSSDGFTPSCAAMTSPISS